MSDIETREYIIEIATKFESWEDAVTKVTRILRGSCDHITEDIVALTVPTPNTVIAAVDALDYALDLFEINEIGEPFCPHRECFESVMSAAMQIVIARKANWEVIKRDVILYMGIILLRDGGDTLPYGIATFRAAKVMVKDWNDHKRQLSNG